VYGWYWKVEI